MKFQLEPIGSEPRGLTQAEAQQRLMQFGRNEISSSKVEGFLQDLRTIFSDPMGLMLLALALLYFILGNRTDTIILIIAFIPVVGVDVLLELRARKALLALKSTLSPFANIFRDGILTKLPCYEIVPGDVTLFEEGQIIAADGVLLESHNLQISEALLTGESVPVSKQTNDIFFAGTTVLSGRGIGLIHETARKTKLGQIAGLIENVDPAISPLRKQIDHLGKQILIIAAVAALVLFSLQFYRSHVVSESLIIALTFAMAAMPEEFPLVYTLYLSLGAWRLSKKGLLVRSLPSVETLAHVDVICVDKTGTLTAGRFSLDQLVPLPAVSPQDLWLFALLACEPNPVDAMESAIFEKAPTTEKDSIKNWKLLWDYPFEGEGKHMTHIWVQPDTGEIIAMKGSPEGVLAHCQISEGHRVTIETTLHELVSQGKRVLALAGKKGKFCGDRAKDELDLVPLAFLVFSDPVRLEVKSVIEKCQNEGLKLKMLTGDHLLTAHAVADQVGLAHDHQSLYTGQDLKAMTALDRSKAYLNGAIFARLMPEQKIEMVQSLQAAGKVVAMTGDGVNDAPALKQADIGISMGEGASDVARSSAQMVLMKNSFAGIIEAIVEGRMILSSLRTSFSYLISFHLPLVLLALIPSLLGWPPLLLPIHIILLELIVHPISAFTFEHLERTGPSSNSTKQTALLTSGQWLRSILSGLFLSVAALTVFKYSLARGEETARYIGILVILFGNISLVLVEVRILFHRRSLITTAILLLMIAGFQYSDFAQNILHIRPAAATDLALTFFLAALSVFWRLFKTKEQPA